MFAFARAPVRIGIAGGGSDLPAWTRHRAGRCLTLAVARYTHATAIDRDDGRVVVSARHLDEAAHATEIANGLAREALLAHEFETNVEVHIASQLTSRGSGLGVSSSIAVALAAALRRARNLDISPSTLAEADDPHDVARAAWSIEINRLRRPVGRQDHMAAAFGGLRLYGFEGGSASVERTFSDEDARWLARHLLLAQLPDGHDARVILSGVRRAEQVQASYDAVETAVEAVQARDPRLLGGALNGCHNSKATIPGAVPQAVADLVNHLRSIDGVRGCKVAGAGGGGHLVLACDEGALEAVRAACPLPVSAVEADLRGVRSEGWL